MTDVTWDFTDDTQTITVDGVQGSTTNITVGETVNLVVFLAPGGASGGHLTAYQEFKTYDRYLNQRAVDYGTDYQGRPWYRFTLHPAATIESYLFKVEPSTAIDAAYPFWGLLTDVTDLSPHVGAGELLELEFFVLAHTSEYATRTDVQNALRGGL